MSNVVVRRTEPARRGGVTRDAGAAVNVSLSDRCRRRVELAVQLPTYGTHGTPENILLVARFADERGLHSVSVRSRWR